jgi:inorganic pyrophosphatase
MLAVVEIPKGSRNKYEWDEEAGRIVLDRFISSSTVYPTDYGYLPGYLGEDGDPLDCLVCVSEPTFPGCGIAVRPVALLKMHDGSEVDDKIVCVPIDDPAWGQIEDLDDLPAHLCKEVEFFFSVYKNLEKEVVEISGWGGAAEALKTMEVASGRAQEPSRTARGSVGA